MADLKLKYIFEYDDAGAQAARSDIESVVAAAGDATRPLSTLASGLDDVGKSAEGAGTSLLDMEDASERAARSLKEGAAASEQMSAAEARAAVALEALAQAGREAERAQADLVDAVERHGAASAEAASASADLERAEKRLATAASEADKSLKAAGKDTGLGEASAEADTLGGKLSGLGERLKSLGDGSPLSSLAGPLGDIGSRIEGLGSGADKAQSLVSGLSGSFSGLGSGGSILGTLTSGFTSLAASINPVTIGIAAIAAGLVGLGVAFAGATRAAFDMQQGVASATAKFGLLEDEARALGDVGLAVWQNNWGESIEAATVRAGELQAVLGRMGSEDLASLTQASFAFEQVFEKGEEDQARMLQGFNRLGVEGEHALDLVTVAMQRTGDPADDLLDTFYEYGPQFERLGFSAEDMTQTLVSGLEAGAFNSDKVADSVKEFGLRLSEGTDATREGLALLDADLANLPDRFLAGEVTGKEAFAIVQQAMRDFEGEIPGQVLADVFGGPGEDLTAGVLMQLDLVGANLGDIEGAAIGAGNAINSNFGAAFDTIKRSAIGALVPLVSPFIEAIRGPALEALSGLAERLQGIGESNAFALLGSAAGLAGRALGGLISGTATFLGVAVDIGKLVVAPFEALFGVLLKIGSVLSPVADGVGSLVTEATAGFGMVGDAVSGAAGWVSSLGGLLGDAAEGEDALAASGERAAESQRDYAEATKDAASSVDPLTAEIDRLQQGFADGSVSAETYAQKILDLKDAGAITEEQFASLGQAISTGIAPLSGDLASFGLSLDTDTLADPEAFVDAINEANAAAHEAITGLYNEQLRAREQFAQDEEALIAEGGQAVNALLEKQAQERGDLLRKQAREEGEAAADPERLAKVREQNAVELQELGIKHDRALQQQHEANANNLQALEDGFEQERQARIAALAQAALDQVNSMLQLGQVTEEQARIIFGSLQQAAPDSSLFDPAAEAALNFSATLGQALAGDVSAAVGLGDELRNIDAALDQSAAHADQYASESVAAYEAARLSVEGTVGAYEISATAAGVHAGEVIARDQSVVDAATTNTGVLSERYGERAVLLDGGALSAETYADRTVQAEIRVQQSATETGGVVDTQQGRQASARGTVGTAAGRSADDVVEAEKRIQREALLTGDTVEAGVGGIGQTFVRSGQGVKEGTDSIVTNVGRANQSMSALGTELPSRLAPGVDALQKLGGEAALLAEDVEGAARTRITAEEDAAGAAVRAADDTTSGFSDLARQTEESQEAVEALAAAMKLLPDRIRIPLEILGIKETQAALKALEADIKAIQTAATIRIYGEYIPKSDPMNPGGSLQLQHDIEDAISAADPGVRLQGSYEGEDGAEWDSGRLAILGALLEVQAAADALDDEPVVIDLDARALQDALAELARLQAEIDALDQSIAATEARYAGPLSRIAGILAAFFGDAAGQAGSLAAVLAELAGVGLAISDEGSFLERLGLSASSFGELQAQLAALADEPEQQQRLWKVFIDGLLDQWGDYYDTQKTRLEAEREQRREAVEAAGDNESQREAAEALLKITEDALAALEDRNDRINDGLSRRQELLGRELDAYKLIASEVGEIAKQQADLERQREQFLRDQERRIKDGQKADEDAEKETHRQTMDLLDEEQKRRERAHKDLLEDIDIRRAAEKAKIDADLKAEEEAHKTRLAQISTRADALQKQYDNEARLISQIKLALDKLEAGGVLSPEEQRLLQNELLVTTDELKRVGEEIARQATLADRLRGLLSKLPDERVRVRLVGDRLTTEAGKALSKVSQEERDALQRALDEGLISDSDRRIVEVALAGGNVRADRLQEILGRVVEDVDEEVAVQETVIEKLQDRLKLRELENATVKQALDDEKRAVADLIAAEDERYAAEQERIRARMDAIDEEERRAKAAHDAFKDAIAEAKEAERDRHDARLKQIQAEHALELMRLGMSEDEVQAELQRQAEAAARIAADAQARYQALIAEAERIAREGGRFSPGGSAGTGGSGLPGGGVSVAPPASTAPPPIPVIPGDPGRQIKPRPGSDPTAIVGGVDVAAALIPIGDVFDGIEDHVAALATAGHETGLAFADGLLDPATERLDFLVERAMTLRDIIADVPGFGEAVVAGNVAVDRGIHFHGPVTIDRDLAEEIGLVDAARLGAP